MSNSKQHDLANLESRMKAMVVKIENFKQSNVMERATKVRSKYFASMKQDVLDACEYEYDAVIRKYCIEQSMEGLDELQVRIRAFVAKTKHYNQCVESAIEEAIGSKTSQGDNEEPLLPKSIATLSLNLKQSEDVIECSSLSSYEQGSLSTVLKWEVSPKVTKSPMRSSEMADDTALWCSPQARVSYDSDTTVESIHGHSTPEWKYCSLLLTRNQASHSERKMLSKVSRQKQPVSDISLFDRRYRDDSNPPTRHDHEHHEHVHGKTMTVEQPEPTITARCSPSEVPPVVPSRKEPVSAKSPSPESSPAPSLDADFSPVSTSTELTGKSSSTLRSDGSHVSGENWSCEAVTGSNTSISPSREYLPPKVAGPGLTKKVNSEIISRHSSSDELDVKQDTAGSSSNTEVMSTSSVTSHIAESSSPASQSTESIDTSADHQGEQSLCTEPKALGTSDTVSTSEIIAARKIPSKSSLKRISNLCTDETGRERSKSVKSVHFVTPPSLHAGSDQSDHSYTECSSSIDQVDSSVDITTKSELGSTTPQTDSSVSSEGVTTTTDAVYHKSEQCCVDKSHGHSQSKKPTSSSPSDGTLAYRDHHSKYHSQSSVYRESDPSVVKSRKSEPQQFKKRHPLKDHNESTGIMNSDLDNSKLKKKRHSHSKKHKKRKSKKHTHKQNGFTIQTKKNRKRQSAEESGSSKAAKRKQLSDEEEDSKHLNAGRHKKQSSLPVTALSQKNKSQDVRFSKSSSDRAEEAPISPSSTVSSASASPLLYGNSRNDSSSTQTSDESSLDSGSLSDSMEFQSDPSARQMDSGYSSQHTSSRLTESDFSQMTSDSGKLSTAPPQSQLSEEFKISETHKAPTKKSRRRIKFHRYYLRGLMFNMHFPKILQTLFYR